MKTKFVLRCGIFLLLLLIGIACTDNKPKEAARQVKGVAAELRAVSDETGGFGTLSFLSKLDITASQDGMIKKMFYREGGNVNLGATVILLENPHINLALERAENLFTQAKAATELSRSRLLEGEFQAEAQLLSIGKSEAELAGIKKKWNEDNRKHQNQEALFDAGGLNQEAILSGRFGLESEWDHILLLEKELEIRKIGCREQDLVAAGFSVPPDENEKKLALVSLMTATLRAELAASLARLEAAEKELQSARIIYGDLNIKSRAAGVVGGRYFEEGK
jgi:multidrug efflux pump subunit AcrA (membrane-fusion protein)